MEDEGKWGEEGQRVGAGDGTAPRRGSSAEERIKSDVGEIIYTHVYEERMKRHIGEMILCVCGKNEKTYR
jgi:hypothetical protein